MSLQLLYRPMLSKKGGPRFIASRSFGERATRRRRWDERRLFVVETRVAGATIAVRSRVAQGYPLHYECYYVTVAWRGLASRTRTCSVFTSAETHVAKFSANRPKHVRHLSSLSSHARQAKRIGEGDNGGVGECT